MKRITIFGGSRVERGSDEYAEAQELGRALAEAGLEVITGGYNGVMEAVSRGAHEAGGHVIGVTVDVIARNFERVPNEYVKQEVRTAALLERIDKLIELGDGFVVLPGGVGTLVELSAVWNLAVLRALQDKPIVIVGRGWHSVLQTMLQELHTIDADLQFLQFADTAQDAVALLARELA